MDERVHMIVFACCGILAVGLVAFLGSALWPFKSQIGLALYIFLCIVLVCVSVDLIGLVIHRYIMRIHAQEQASLNAQVIEAAGIAAYVNTQGRLYNLSGWTENAKVFPVESEDTTLEEAQEVKRLHDLGMGERTIGSRMNMSRSAVRVLLGKPRTKKEGSVE